MNDKSSIYDNALCLSKNMFAGDEKFQVRARTALPILVQQAHARETITYKNLAKELEMWYRNLDDVYACISTTLYELVEKSGEKKSLALQILSLRQTINFHRGFASTSQEILKFNLPRENA